MRLDLANSIAIYLIVSALLGIINSARISHSGAILQNLSMAPALMLMKVKTIR